MHKIAPRHAKCDSRGFSDAPLAASEENEFSPGHKTLRSNASSMICWADTTLPSSRVRSDALRTNLLRRVLLGRSVIGTVSGCLGVVFFGFEFADASAVTGVSIGSAGDTKNGAGTEPVPAGWLAAAAIRAARSLESRFFFISGRMLRLRDATASQYPECATLQYRAVMRARYHSTLPSQRCKSTTLQSCGGTILPCRNVPTLQPHKAIALWFSNAAPL